MLVLKVMKIGPRNKWRKVVHQVSTDDCYRNLIWSSIDGSTHPRSIENYNFRISRSKIRPRLMSLFRVSFLTNLDIYKPYFKSHHTRIQRPRDLFSLWEATAFVHHRVLKLSASWSSLLIKWRTLQPTTSFKLLELVMY